MAHSPENSEAIIREIQKPPLEGDDQQAVAAQANQLADTVEQIATVLRMPRGSDVQDVVEAVRVAQEEPRRVLGLHESAPASAVSEEIGHLRSRERELTDAFDDLVELLDLTTGTSVADAIALVRQLKAEASRAGASYAALHTESNEVRAALGLSVRDASTTEVLDRLRDRLRALADCTAALRGLAVASGLGEDVSNTRLVTRILQLMTFHTKVRDLVGLDELQDENEVFARVEECVSDAKYLGFIRRHLRMEPDTIAVDVERLVALLQAEAESVREHLFLPREVEFPMVTKAIKDLRQQVLDAAQYGRPASIVIPFDTLPQGRQEWVSKLIQEHLDDRGHVRALASALALDEDASAEWVVEVLLDRLRTLVGLDAMPPTERSAYETLQVLAERVTIPMVDHSPQPGIHYQVIRESSGPRGLSLYDLRSASFLARKISFGEIYSRLWTLIQDGHQRAILLQLSRAIDAEQTNVHIGGPLSDDLQVSVFPQDGPPKAQVTLKLDPVSAAPASQDKIHFVPCLVSCREKTIVACPPGSMGTTVTLTTNDNGMFVVTRLGEPRVISRMQTLVGARSELLSGQFGQRYGVAVQSSLVDALLRGKGGTA